MKVSPLMTKISTASRSVWPKAEYQMIGFHGPYSMFTYLPLLESCP